MAILFVSMFIPLVIVTMNTVKKSTQEEKINDYLSDKTSEIKIIKSENTFNIIEPTLNEIERVNIALSLIAYLGYKVDASVEISEENNAQISSARAIYISTISFMNLIHEVKSFPSSENYVSYIFDYSINKSIHNIRYNGSLIGQIECGFKYLDNVFRSVSDSYKIVIDLCISEYSSNRDKFNNKIYSIRDVELFTLSTIEKVMRTVDEGPQVTFIEYKEYLDGYRKNTNSSQVPVI